MSYLRMAVPPVHLRCVLTLSVAGDTDLRRLRSELRTALAVNLTAGEAVPDGFAQAAGLVATELAGNALRHGFPPVVVRLLRDDDCYVLEVSDHAREKLPELAGTDQRLRAGGRGLQIVLSVAEHVGWYQTVDTKRVWASFPVPRSS